MRAFGRHWVVFSSASSYRAIFQMAGGGLDEFLMNLDRMHESIQGTLPEADMPSFETLDVGPDHHVIVYRSSRLAALPDALNAFVGGLLDGLLAHFGEEGDVESEPLADGIRFTIRRRASNAA